MTEEQPLLMRNPFTDNQGQWRYIHPRDNELSGPFETEAAALQDWIRREQYD